jgi:hypothetical protein
MNHIEVNKAPFRAVAYWTGYVGGLHLAPRAMLPLRTVDSLNLIEGKGVEGDRYMLGTGHLTEKLAEMKIDHRRHISFFEQETVDALARDHGIELVPGEHRRNVTTVGVPLMHLIGRRFSVGSTIIEGSYDPVCKHLEDVIGKPVANHLINRCGLFGKIVVGGRVRTGDVIRLA